MSSCLGHVHWTTVLYVLPTRHPHHIPLLFRVLYYIRWRGLTASKSGPHGLLYMALFEFVWKRTHNNGRNFLSGPPSTEPSSPFIHSWSGHGLWTMVSIPCELCTVDSLQEGGRYGELDYLAEYLWAACRMWDKVECVKKRFPFNSILNFYTHSQKERIYNHILEVYVARHWSTRIQCSCHWTISIITTRVRVHCQLRS